MDDPIFTKAVHVGAAPDTHFGALSVPIYKASVFALPDAERGAAIHEGEAPGYFYGRMGTPTQAALERALAELEGGDAALATASGMAAISTALLTLLRPGDRLVAPRAIYSTSGTLFNDLLVPFGVGVDWVDGTQPGAYAEAARSETRVFYVETPANPTLDLVDLEEVIAAAGTRGVITVVDNTFGTPCNQRPLAMGADLVVHSASKFLGGHGDLIAGALIGRESLVCEARWRTMKVLGGVLSPEIAWLVLRGLRTLPLRMERHNHNAGEVALFLEGHPAVRRVNWPGLRSHAQHDLARRQMRGFGGVLSFDVGTPEAARRVVNAVTLCTLAVSLGDVTTLIQHSASMTHASMPPERRSRAGIAPGLLRLSVGLERVADIIDDLDQALRTL